MGGSRWWGQWMVVVGINGWWGQWMVVVGVNGWWGQWMVVVGVNGWWGQWIVVGDVNRWWMVVGGVNGWWVVVDIKLVVVDGECQWAVVGIRWWWEGVVLGWVSMVSNQHKNLVPKSTLRFMVLLKLSHLIVSTTWQMAVWVEYCSEDL